MNKIEFYRNRIVELLKEEQALTLKLKWMGALRLSVFVGLVLVLFGYLPKHINYGLILGFGTTLLFLYLVRKYHLLSEKRKHIRLLLEINQNESAAINSDFSAFQSGEEYIDPSHAYSYDMDLFGEGSVFQYINRTVTTAGKQRLASLFNEGNMNIEFLEEQQKSIQELSQQPLLLQDFQARGKKHHDTIGDIEGLKKWMELPFYYLNKKIFRAILFLLPAITLISIPLAIFIPQMQMLPVVLYFVQLALVGSRLSHTQAEYRKIGTRLQALKKYSLLLESMEGKRFESKQLKEISDTLVTKNYSAAMSIRQLSRITQAFDSRLNILVAILLQGLFLYDLRCMLNLEKWKNSQGRHLNDWLEAMARFDSLVSLSNFAFNHPEFIYPQFSEHIVFEGKDIGHLLLPEKERVVNSFTLSGKGKFVIVTGANMAGKSTFLRSIASNRVLAFCGAPVCAAKLILKPMKIFSSMRTTDSLNKHESYFYAELKRLKEMFDLLRQGEELFILLDEILKGTNSEDKRKGSIAVLEHIIKFNGTGIIATHDLELAAIESKYRDIIENQCFEIEIKNGTMHFDYKLQPGITQHMNAMLLMEQMGIIG